MIRVLRRPLLLAVGVLVGASVASAADLHVPSQYATIQQAIAAATPGDKVLVQPGTYHEAIDFVGKGIEVIGVGGATVTTIDATGLGTSVATMRNNEPPTTLLRGFTITGGSGQAGGGLYITARPTVRDCLITGNSAGGGGGILTVQVESPGSVPTFIDCEIYGNSVSGYGGGIAVGNGTIFSLSPLFRNCEIRDNQAGNGGGCYGWGDFVDCVIEGNVATQYGGGAYSVHSLKGSLLRGNTAASSGGGYYDYQIYGVSLIDCTLIENSAQVGGGAFLASDSPSPIFGPEALVSGCVFARNSAASHDGLAISFTSYVTAQTTITNCSFDMNLFSGGGSLEIRNCIIRGVSFSSAIAASYSNIEGGAVGSGNIDADPLWVDPAGGDYHLQGCSPCIDVADPASPHDPDGTPADMGALPFASWTDLGGGVGGSLGVPALTGAGLPSAGAPVDLSLTNAPPSAPVWLILSVRLLGTPFKGGTFWPTLDVVVTGLGTDASGTVQLSGSWPPLIGCGFTMYAQAWSLDAGAESGWAGSNGLRCVSR